jgi:hypothetical protein
MTLLAAILMGLGCWGMFATIFGGWNDYEDQGVTRRQVFRNLALAIVCWWAGFSIAVLELVKALGWL